MQRVLVTGMSGTGKSTVMQVLTERGYRAVDTDDGWVEVLPDGTQRWREAEIRALLADEDAPVLFLAGCEENMAGLLPEFDVVILLSAPREVLLDRLATRTNNPFGKNPYERSRILHDLDEVEPLLRAIASHEVVTTGTPAEVVDHILRLVVTDADA